MTLLAQLSDPHVEAGPGDVPSARALGAAVEAVRAVRPAPEAALVSGDVAADGRPEEYARARELLAPLEMPVHVLAGNHDDRAAFRAAFELEGSGDEPVRFAVACGALRLVGCDTTRAGREDGRLDAGELAWLEAALAAEPRTPTIVAMHHPPFEIGLRGMDAIGLPAADRTALAGVLARAPHVRRVVTGHVHRAAFGLLGGHPVFTCPSTHLQVRLDILGPDVVLEPAPPAFALHRWTGDALVTHVQPVASGRA